MQCIPILSLPALLTGTVSSRRFLNYTGAQTTAGGNAAGVTNNSGVAGEYITIHVIGTAIIETGGAIAVGALVESDASGRAITRAAGFPLGRALRPSTGAGQFIEILLLGN